MISGITEPCERSGFQACRANHAGKTGSGICVGGTAHCCCVKPAREKLVRSGFQGERGQDSGRTAGHETVLGSNAVGCAWLKRRDSTGYLPPRCDYSGTSSHSTPYAFRSVVPAVTKHGTQPYPGGITMSPSRTSTPD